MSSPWVTPFLEALRECGILAEAARRAGASYSTVMARRKTDADFAAAVDDALEESFDAMEAEARRRAVEGVDKGVWHQGVQVGTERVYSDSLMQFLLKGYRKRFATDRTELTGADGGPVQMDDTARAARVAQLMALAKQRQDTDLAPDDIA